MGITVGCLIGMVPLLFMDNDKKKKDDGEADAAPVNVDVAVN